MKSAFLGLRTLGYIVHDLAAAKAWYIQAFGVDPYFDEPFYVGFNIGGYELGLMPAEGQIQTGNNSYTYWGVDDIHATYDRLLALGATEREAPMNVGGELMVATVFDPWSNIIGMIYNPYFKAE
jgi:predicted enzyme related to lactoylglutathione lyase